jgi:hypothetical protein
MVTDSETLETQESRGHMTFPLAAIIMKAFYSIRHVSWPLSDGGRESRDPALGASRRHHSKVMWETWGTATFTQILAKFKFIGHHHVKSLKTRSSSCAGKSRNPLLG